MKLKFWFYGNIAYHFIVLDSNKFYLDLPNEKL